MEVNEINPDWLLREIAKLNSAVHAPLRQMHLDQLKKDILAILNVRMRAVEDMENRIISIFSRLNTLEVVLQKMRSRFDMQIECNNMFHAKFAKLENEMAKLTTKARKALPKKAFALPKEEKYPIEDKSHARNAKARASEMKNKGKISESTKEKIDSKADKVLKKGKKK